MAEPETMRLQRTAAKRAGQLAELADDMEDFLEGLTERVDGYSFVRLTVDTIHRPTDEDGSEGVGSFMMPVPQFLKVVGQAKELLDAELDAAGVD